MATEPQDSLTGATLEQNLKDVKVEVPVTNLQLPNVSVAPHSQFWADLNARLAADKKAMNEMIAREIPSAIAPPPLSDAEKAMKEIFDEVASRPQPNLFVIPDTDMKPPYQNAPKWV